MNGNLLTTSVDRTIPFITVHDTNYKYKIEQLPIKVAPETAQKPIIALVEPILAQKKIGFQHFDRRLRGNA
jgi:hypothetical protein